MTPTVDYTSNTMKYYKSVGRIGTSANTPSRGVIFHGIRSIIIFVMYACAKICS